MEAEYIQSCNCDWGCPCNFDALPTHGNCEALVAYRVKRGKFGDTKLDGVVFAEGLWWPKAIHEGDGMGADPSGHKIDCGRNSKAPKPHHQYGGAFEPPLTIGSHLGKDEMSTVTLRFLSS